MKINHNLHHPPKSPRKLIKKIFFSQTSVTAPQSLMAQPLLPKPATRSPTPRLKKRRSVKLKPGLSRDVYLPGTQRDGLNVWGRSLNGGGLSASVTLGSFYDFCFVWGPKCKGAIICFLRSSFVQGNQLLDHMVSSL